MNNEYSLIFDKQFTKKFRKLDNSIQVEGEKKIKQLKQNPRGVGKPLKYFSNLFELHTRMYRIFYVVEEHRLRVLLLSIEHKDETDRYLKSLTTKRIKELIGENP